jgi:ribosome maturation factor RimP
MIAAEIIEKIENQLLELISGNPELFLVAIKTDAKNNIRILLDGDKGVSIDDCARINRGLYRTIEEKNWLDTANFSLEVSSPGLDEPLKLHRQYVKNTGRRVELQLQDGSVLEGLMKAVEEKQLTIEETRGKGKKQEVIEHQVALDQVKSAKIKIII